jgi:hypothetical protein
MGSDSGRWRADVKDSSASGATCGLVRPSIPVPSAAVSSAYACGSNAYDRVPDDPVPDV